MAPTNPALTAEMLLAHGEWLRRLAAHLLRDAPDAEDLVQDSWEAALRSPPDPARPVRPWLAQVLRNAVQSRRRGSVRRAARERAAVVDSDATSPEELLERARLHERIVHLLNTLEEPYRTTLLLRFHDGRGAADIARTTNVPAGTVRWRVSEGIRRLRERLEDQPGEGRRWRVILAPVTVTPRLAWRPWMVTTAGAVAVLLGAASMLGGSWRERRPSGGPVAAVRSAPATVNVPDEAGRTEVAAVNRGNIRRMTAFLTVVLPALMVAAAPPASPGRPVDLDFKNAEIKNILRLLSQVGEVNIWTADDVAGPVTVKVKRVPWDQVVAQICADRGLHWQRNDNVILISRAALPSPRPYFGRRLDPDFTGDGKGVDVRVAMAQLANAGKVKIEVADSVKATIRMKGRDMPWDQVLDVILWSKGLRGERQGDLIRIIPSR
jgi:RNA polymerase sigma factor (sigma-70 family)